jgi:3-oxoacyl-[acyl-carrier-protein] synthase-1/3-oxoacyl-[acyl-carrier-protein] synthase II
LTGGDYSFEQALFTASLLAEKSDQPCIVIGADEHHPDFTPLFDSSSRLSQDPSDGGAAFCLQHGSHPLHPTLCCLFYAHANKNPGVISQGVATLNKVVSDTKGIGAVLYGIPKCYESTGKLQLDSFTAALNFKGPQISYRSFTGEFATASAVATSLALALVRDQKIPTTLTGTLPLDLNGQGILILGLGKYISAILVNA